MTDRVARVDDTWRGAVAAAVGVVIRALAVGASAIVVALTARLVDWITP